jgi:hypothetical protein
MRQTLAILIDGAEVAQCLQPDAGGHHGTAQITEVLEVAAGATLTVGCGVGGGSVGQQLQNRLSVVLLQAL